RPGASVVDVAGEALLAAIEIDGGDALAGLHQGDGDMQGGGGFTGTALLIAQHNDMSRARLPLPSLHQHFANPCGYLRIPRDRGQVKCAMTSTRVGKML